MADDNYPPERLILAKYPKGKVLVEWRGGCQSVILGFILS
jgi:hypothetical protein